MSGGIETEKVEEEDVLVLSKGMVERRILGSSAEQNLDLIKDPGVQLRCICCSSALRCECPVHGYRPFVKSSNSSP